MMGFLGDLNELKNYWNKSSLLTRMLMTVFLFLNVSSLTSLSENIFKWKNFILDGLNFYREFISNPIMNAANSIGVYFTLEELDFLAVLTILLASVIRGIYAFNLDHIKKYSALYCIVYLLTAYKMAKPGISGYSYYSFLIFIPMFIFYFKGAIRMKALAIPIISTLVVLILASISLGLTK